MGGSGSGRFNRLAPKVSDYLMLNVSAFKLSDFEKGETGRYIWTLDGSEIASIVYRLERDFLELDYVYRKGGGSHQVLEEIAFEFATQPFGGYRRFFVCPSCNRKCRILLGAQKFRCRRCRQATYPSQYDHVHIKELVLAERTRKRLGGESGFMNGFPQKPAGMHWRSFEAMKARDYRVTRRLEMAMCRV